jgi:hypothetical protein
MSYKAFPACDLQNLHGFFVGGFLRVRGVRVRGIIIASIIIASIIIVSSIIVSSIIVSGSVSVVVKSYGLSGLAMHPALTPGLAMPACTLYS